MALKKFRTGISNKEINQKLSCAFSFNVHDSSVSFALGNKVVLVLEAERIFRVKKKRCDYFEMNFLIEYGLDLLEKNVNDVDFWAMTTLNNPFLCYMDIVDIEKMDVKMPYYKSIKLLGAKRKVLVINHHLAHAGLFFSTDSESGIVISCDGGGDYNPSIKRSENLAVFKVKKNNIKKIKINLDGIVTGKTYGVCSKYLYNDSSTEGKMMALAALGESSQKYLDFLETNYKSIEVTDYYFVQKILNEKVPELYESASSLAKDALDFARTVQDFFVKKRHENTLNIINSYSKNISAVMLTGGVVLNLELNSHLSETLSNKKIKVLPCCDDTGQSLGALCILIAKVFNKRASVTYPYLGEGAETYSYRQDTINKCVNVLINDGVVIIHNGKSEIGPRALGNRSFVARADKLSVKIKLSEEIKSRESYRPVAPIVCEDMFCEYFEGHFPSPYMLFSQKIKNDYKNILIGAIHIDGTARVQTINSSSNKFMYDLIKAFGEKTGISVLLNTSLNFKGDPIANKLEDSLEIYKKLDAPKCLIHDGQLINYEI